MIFDLHIHSKYSQDSLLSPEKIIRISKKNNLSGIAVTDHNTIIGGLQTYKRNKDCDFEVIVGSEIRTNYGDILGLFLNEDITTKDFFCVMDAIKDQGGISILAHPYRQFKYPESICQYVNLIEGFNSRSQLKDNLRAFKLGSEFNKSMTGGSDAHLYFEIGNAGVIVDDDIETSLKHGTIKCYGTESNYFFAHGLSFMIENFRKLMRLK